MSDNQVNAGKPQHSRRNASSTLQRVLLWSAGTLAAIIVVLFIASFFLDEPLRRYTETKLNKDLKGYSVKLPGLHFQLIGLGLTLKQLTVFQQAHPQPPIAVFPVLRAGIHWRSILSGRLVAEFRLDRPQVEINLPQLRAEAASKVPIKKRGWQQAVEDIYPLKINVLAINDGRITYIDQDAKKPLYLSHLNLRASNIRNVRLPDRVYPSTFRLETDIFGTGHGIVDGRANFLGEPYPGIKAGFKLGTVPLDYFAPVVARSNLTIHNGLFSASGGVEYAPNVKVAQISDVTVKGMQIEYNHMPSTAAAEKSRAEKVAEATKKLGKSKMLIRIGRLNLSECTIGMVNETARHPYRVFLSDTDLLLTNLSNQSSQGTAKAELRGKFMGSGATSATAYFRPATNGPDFDLNVRIIDTRMKDMNNLFRAYGNFDVADGYFSLYSELHVRNDAISGYVKPLFKDIKVFDERNEKEKSLFHKMYEMMIGGVAKLLKSGETGEVATKTEISGMVKKPEVNTWQIIGRLIENAFFKAILPGFEREVTRKHVR